MPPTLATSETLATDLGLLIRLLYSVDHLAVRDVVSAEPIGIEHDLILPDHAADTGDFRDVGDRSRPPDSPSVQRRSPCRAGCCKRGADRDRARSDIAGPCRRHWRLPRRWRPISAS